MRYAILLLVPLLALLAACAGAGAPEATPSPSPAVARLSPTPEPAAEPTAPPDFQGSVYFTSFDVGAQVHLLYSIKPDGTHLTKLATLPPGAFCCSLSPDGKLLAFVETETTDGAVHFDDDISILDVGTGALTNITNTPRQADLTNDERVLGWSPDGTHIAFKTHHLPIPSGRGDYDTLELMAPDGSGRRSLISEEFFSRTPAVTTFLDWSPAGDAFVFRMLTAGDEAQGGHLFLMRADGSGMKDISGPIVNTDVGGAAWRPDGRAVAVSLANTGLYLVDVSDYELRGATSLYPTLAAYEIKWSPEGSKLGLDGPGGISVLGSDGAGLLTVGKDRRPGSGFAWSPHGDRIAYVLLGGPCVEGCPAGPLAVVNADGSGSRALTEMPVDGVIGWVPLLGEATDSLNIRKQPNTTSEVMGSLKKGDKVGLIGQVEGEEAEAGSGNRIWFQTPRGFIYSAFVKR